MSIIADALAVVPVGDLLRADLRVPNYQRPYSWEPRNALQLLDDIRDAQRTTAERYAIGSVVLYQSRGAGHYDIVDGQQRLLTLSLLCGLLRGDPSPFSGALRESKVVSVYTELRRSTRLLGADEAASLSKYIDDRCILVRIVTDDEDEAFRFFDSQNYRGKALKPHDLLKSFHLREMRAESETVQAAIVEAWERAAESELERLFAGYLYRVARWSRGQDAGVFSARDIDLFKGIPSTSGTLPVADYHRAAQGILPILGPWAVRGTIGQDGEGWDSQRSRFQLDLPIVAGRPFFEMVAFMLREVKRVESLIFSSEASPAEPPSSKFADFRGHYRYRYAAELMICAVIYYVNKFGEQDIAALRTKAFLWAYALRLDYLRVTWRSVNNYARGRGTVDDEQRNAFRLFEVIRNSVTGGEVRRLVVTTRPTPREPGDEQLRAFMNTLEGIDV